MKAIVILTISFYFSLNAYAQPERRPARMTYTPRDYSKFEQLVREKDQKYTQNAEYIQNLKYWIHELENETTEELFLSEMQSSLNKLRTLEGGDLAESYLDIREVEMAVKVSIDDYNKRVEELPVKLWESGKSKQASGDLEGAIADYSSLISIDPDFLGTYLQRGYLYYLKGQYQEALSDLNIFIKNNSNVAFAYETRGWTKNILQDHIGAMSDFNQQILLQPTEKAYYNRGSVKSELGDNFGAIEDYTKAIEMNPNFSMAYNNRGWAKFKMKKPNESIVDLNMALEIDPKNAVAWDSRQEVKYSLGDYQGCIADCDKAIELISSMANSYFFRGKAKLKLGKKEEACKDFSKAGELGIIESYALIKANCN